MSKSKITEEWVEEWCKQIVGIFWWHKEDRELKEYIIQMLKEVGVDILVSKSKECPRK